MADKLSDGPAPASGCSSPASSTRCGPASASPPSSSSEEATTVEVPQAADLLRPARLQQRRYEARRRPRPAGRRGLRFHDYVVVPSGSCGGMIRRHYPEALADDPAWRARGGARREDLRDHHVPGRCPRLPAQRAHAAAHGHLSRRLRGPARGRRVRPAAPLLAAVDGLEMRKLEGNDVCCGFGGTFCVKYPAILRHRRGEGGGDRADGCGPAARRRSGVPDEHGGKPNRGSAVRCFHTIEVLAGLGDGPAIGEEG